MKSSFFRSFKKYAPINVKNSIANLRSNVPPEEYEFVAFKLLDTERNREYNITLADTHSPYTYVYFELKTGYFDSSSCKLAMELTIEQGLDDDADENSRSICTMPPPSGSTTRTNLTAYIKSSDSAAVMYGYSSPGAAY